MIVYFCNQQVRNIVIVKAVQYYCCMHILEWYIIVLFIEGICSMLWPLEKYNGVS